MKIFGIYNPVIRVVRVVYFLFIAIGGGAVLLMQFSTDRDASSFICLTLFFVLLWILNRRRICNWLYRHQHDEIGKAARSLPWYVVGTFLVAPLALAIFTGGSSLIWYLLPIAIADKKTPLIGIVSALVLPGLLLWTIRQFFRLAAYRFRANRGY